MPSFKKTASAGLTSLAVRVCPSTAPNSGTTAKLQFSVTKTRAASKTSLCNRQETPKYCTPSAMPQNTSVEAKSCSFCMEEPAASGTKHKGFSLPVLRAARNHFGMVEIHRSFHYREIQLLSQSLSTPISFFSILS